MTITQIEEHKGAELQLGLAIENQTATLSIERRLAYEQISYFAQVSLKALIGLGFHMAILPSKHESCIENSWFKVLSELHMMAILLFLEASSLLVLKNLMDASKRNVSEDCKKDFIDPLLKPS
ncbi:hypothetical protein GIB67_033166, partial [Kingdonia uniflora]